MFHAMNDSQQNPLLLSSAGASAASASQRKFRQNYIQNMLNRSASGLSNSQKSGSMSISTTSKAGKSSPGPGSYNISNSLIDSKPRYFYGKHIPEKFHVPSPTRYQPNSAKSSIKQTPKESLSVTKSFKQEETITPGPGAYNLNQKRPVSVHSSLNKAIDFAKKPTPGPADYCHQPNYYQTNPKLYRSERMDGIQPPPDYPGPGSYLGPQDIVTSMSAVSIKHKYPTKQEITPSFYELDKSFKAVTSSTAKPRIGEKYYNAMNDFDGQQAREARINERLKQIQSKRQKNLESQLDQQLRMGRKMLGIGTEGRWVPKADAWAMAERAGVFRFYPMQRQTTSSRVSSRMSVKELEPQRISRLSQMRQIEQQKTQKITNNNLTHETHFAILAPSKTKYAELVIHGKMTFDNNYPHNNCKITIIWPKIVFLSADIILPKQFVETYTPEFGLHWAMQVLHQRMSDFLRDKPDFDIQTLVSESKQYKCQQCGCNNEDFYQQLIDNEARYEYLRDELVEQKLGIQFDKQQ